MTANERETHLQAAEQARAEAVRLHRDGYRYSSFDELAEAVRHLLVVARADGEARHE